MPKVEETVDKIFYMRIAYGIHAGSYQSWYMINKFTQSTYIIRPTKEAAIKAAKEEKRKNNVT